MRESRLNLRRKSLLVEPPSSAATDIALTMIIFFIICASTQPDSGRAQEIPRIEEKSKVSEQSKNVEVSLTPTAAVINGTPTPIENVTTRVKSLLAGKTREADRVVVVKSANDVPYAHWIEMTGLIENAGAVITLQLEEEQVETVD